MGRGVASVCLSFYIIHFHQRNCNSVKQNTSSQNSLSGFSSISQQLSLINTKTQHHNHHHGSPPPPASASWPPLYMAMPGAEERLARQTTKWAPRWERNINYFTSPAERTAQRIEPPIAKAIKKLDEKLPLEKMAKGMERGIQKSIARFQPPKSEP
ncbi:hypothetical protein TrVGV298_003490 [Trichoderma virens]|nr:hypothetical protein TrVGV298_003490 [Trichoderma virens]